MKNLMLISLLFFLPYRAHSEIVYPKIQEGLWTLMGIDGGGNADGHRSPTCVLELVAPPGAGYQMRLSIATYQTGPDYMNLVIGDNSWIGPDWVWEVFDSKQVFFDGPKDPSPNVAYSWAQKLQNHTIIIRDIGGFLIRMMKKRGFLAIVPQIFLDANSCDIINQDRNEAAVIFSLKGFGRLWNEHVQDCLNTVRPYSTILKKPNSMTFWKNYKPGMTWTNPHPNCHKSEADD